MERARELLTERAIGRAIEPIVAAERDTKPHGGRALREGRAVAEGGSGEAPLAFASEAELRAFVRGALLAAKHSHESLGYALLTMDRALVAQVGAAPFSAAAAGDVSQRAASAVDVVRRVAKTRRQSPESAEREGKKNAR